MTSWSASGHGLDHEVLRSDLGQQSGSMLPVRRPVWGSSGRDDGVRGGIISKYRGVGGVPAMGTAEELSSSCYAGRRDGSIVVGI